VERAELVYAGFSLSLPSYDPEATALSVQRVLAFLSTR
jgi:hypothetical protein